MPNVICPICGREQKPGAKFCAFCGALLPEKKSFCGECGAVLKPGAQFCPSCGMPVKPSSAQTPPYDAPAQIYSPEEEYIPEKKSNTWIVWVVCGLILAAMIAVIVIFVLPAITSLGSSQPEASQEAEDEPEPTPEPSSPAPTLSPSPSPAPAPQSVTVTEADMIKLLTRYYYSIPMDVYDYYGTNGNNYVSLTEIDDFLSGYEMARAFVWNAVDTGVYQEIERLGYGECTQKEVFESLFGEGCIMLDNTAYYDSAVLIPKDGVLSYIARCAGRVTADALSDSIFSDGYFTYYPGDMGAFTVVFEYEENVPIVSGSEYRFSAEYYPDSGSEQCEMDIHLMIENDEEAELGAAITGFRVSDISYEYASGDDWLSDLVLEGARRYYSYTELYALDQYQLSVLRNGMYALSGKIFSRNQEIISFFNDCDWYYGRYADDAVVQQYMNDYQLTNLELIIEVERALGYRQ